MLRESEEELHKLTSFARKHAEEPILPETGCTACMAIIAHGKIYLGNCGDSRAVLGTIDKAAFTAKPLSFDHKPVNPKEKARIEAR